MRLGEAGFGDERTQIALTCSHFPTLYTVVSPSPHICRLYHTLYFINYLLQHESKAYMASEALLQDYNRDILTKR